MSNDDLLKFAEAAGFSVFNNKICSVGYTAELTKPIETLCALVQRATAEDCAKVCDLKAFNFRQDPTRYQLHECGADIRTKYQLK